MSSGPGRIQRGYPLLLALLFLHVLAVSAADSRWLRVGLVVGVLATAAWASSPSRGLRAVGFGLAGGVLLVSMAGGEVEAGVLALASLYVFFVTGVVLRDVLRHREVSAGTLCGALATYLMLALGWGLAYTALEALRPGSFGGLSGVLEADVRALQYLSVVTLTTLGYGDIVPRAELARGLCAVEALVGQLFLAVLVAALVARYVAAELGRE